MCNSDYCYLPNIFISLLPLHMADRTSWPPGAWVETMQLVLTSALSGDMSVPLLSSTV